MLFFFVSLGFVVVIGEGCYATFPYDHDKTQRTFFSIRLNSITLCCGFRFLCALCKTNEYDEHQRD
jgi:hypothetical protein